MRILISTIYRNVIGGTEKYLKSLIPGLLGSGHEVALLHEERSNPSVEPIDTRDLGLPAWCVAELGPDAALESALRWRPDLVYNQRLCDGGLEDSLLNRCPAVLFAHNYYGTCGTGTKCHSWPRIEPCERRFGLACLVYHHPRRCGGLSPLTALRIFQQERGRNTRLPRYRSVLVASRHMQHELVRHGLDAERVQLLPLPAEEQVAPVPGPRNWHSGARILFLGRLMRSKGCHYLIEAIASIPAGARPPLHLTVAGEGPERSNLERLASELGVNARFTGWVDSATKDRLLSESDLLAVPSLWPEPFGLVGIEAGRLGVPSVGFAVGGIPDWLIPGETGELAPAGPPTVRGLREAICRVFSSGDHYARLSRGARENATRFTLSAHLRGLEPILERASGVH